MEVFTYLVTFRCTSHNNANFFLPIKTGSQKCYFKLQRNVTSYAGCRNLNWDATLFRSNVTHSASGHYRPYLGFCWPRHVGVADPLRCTKPYILFPNTVAGYCARHRYIDVLTFQSNFVCSCTTLKVVWERGVHKRFQNYMQNLKYLNFYKTAQYIKFPS